MTTRAYIGLGGNVGDPRATMNAAIEKLNALGVEVTARSGDYETPPWGKTDQPPFVNAAIAVETELSAHDLLKTLLQVEQSLGRQRMEKWGPRTIDLDILAYGNETIDDEVLKVPHPYLLERAFVVVPLAEIAPWLTVNGVTMTEAMDKLDIDGIVRLEDDDDDLYLGDDL